MPFLDIDKMTKGLSRSWSGFLREWDRHLRAGNYPETTRYSYLLSAAQLCRFLASIRLIRTPVTPPMILAR
jgi:hypothetical protein